MNPLRTRLIKSIVTGVLFLSFLVFAFLKIQNAPEEDSLSSLLRKSLHFNESIWQTLSNSNRLSAPLPKPARGKPPRANGDLGLSGPIDIAHYTVTIETGEQHLKLPMSAFFALPKSGYSTLFKCVEGWSETIQYGGARFSDFVEAYHLGTKPDGSKYRYVGFETPDAEYYVSLDIESMMHPQTVLAYEMNDTPLDSKNGAPLRLIIPIKYGIKSIKRIGKIIFSDTRPPDYWTEQGYDWWAGL